MLASILTTLAIALLLSGVGFYAYRRISKTWHAQQERSAAAEAALISEAAALIDAEPGSISVGDAGAEAPANAEDPSPVDQATGPDAEPEAVGPEGAPVGPRTVEEDIRAFFGKGTAEVPVPAAVPVPDVSMVGRHVAEPEPVAVDRLDDAVAALVQAFRDAAVAVERAAEHGDPDPAVRASRVWTAATSAIGVLPLSGLVTSHRTSQQS